MSELRTEISRRRTLAIIVPQKLALLRGALICVCSGRSESALRQGFRLRRKRLYGAKAPPARRTVGCFSRKNCKRPERIWIVTPCQN